MLANKAGLRGMPGEVASQLERAAVTSIEADKYRAACDTRTLSDDLVRRATGVEGRMQKCCEYHFDPHRRPGRC